MNKAYITLLSSEDYLEAVLVLNYSLRLVNSQYPLVVYVTNQVYNNEKIINTLSKENIIIEKEIDKYEYCQDTLNYLKSKTDDYRFNTLKNTSSKIGILDLKQYDKLCYIDADSIVLKNIDDIFDYPSGSMLWDGVQGLSTLMVFEPKWYQTEYYKSLIDNNILTDGALFSIMWNNCVFDNNYRISNDDYVLSEDIYNSYYTTVKLVSFGEFRENKLWFYKTKDLLNSQSLLKQKYGIILAQLRNEYNNFDFIKKENYF